MISMRTTPGELVGDALAHLGCYFEQGQEFLWGNGVRTTVRIEELQ